MLLFNSLDKLQTKPLPPIRHICDFSRGVLNVRFMRSHPTLAPRPQICLIGSNGFCAVAGEGQGEPEATKAFGVDADITGDGEYTVSITNASIAYDDPDEGDRKSTRLNSSH